MGLLNVCCVVATTKALTLFLRVLSIDLRDLLAIYFDYDDVEHLGLLWEGHYAYQRSK